MDTDNQVIAKWTELKAIVDTLELDIVKNAKGVAAAGVRARKGMRALKNAAAELVKLTVELDKAKRAAKPAKGVPAV
jgi:hypothetical protein